METERLGGSLLSRSKGSRRRSACRPTGAHMNEQQAADSAAESLGML